MAIAEKGGGGHEAAGMMRWLLTYADAVTLLLIVFIVLYSFSATNLKKFEQAAASIMNAFGRGPIKGGTGVLKGTQGLLKGGVPDIATIPSPAEVQALKGVTKRFSIPDTEVKAMEKTQAEIKEAFDKAGLGGISTTMSERGLVVSLADKVFFDLGKADINEDALPLLNKLTEVLATKGNPIRIEGHTDNIPMRSSAFPSNWELSTARATSVLRYLMNAGRIYPGRLSAAGYGEFKPLAPNLPPAQGGQPKNRRVDIVLLFPSLSLQEPKGNAR